METWDIRSLDVAPHNPQVLDSDAEGRVIVINLPAGEQLSEHQVHERAWLFVVEGDVELANAGGDTVSGGAGLLASWDPKERHEVRAKSEARLLLLLAPWPGEGHPSQR